MRGELDLLFERAVQLDQLRVHGLRGVLQMRVLADELVALDGVFQRGDELLVQPRLDDEAENFALVDRGDDGVEIEHGGRQDARGKRLDLPRLGEQFQAGQLRHQLVGDDDGKFPAAEFCERGERRTVGDGLIAGAVQRLLERGKKNLLVIHDENRIARLRNVIRRVHGAPVKLQANARLAGGDETVGPLEQFQIFAGFAKLVELFARGRERGLQQALILPGQVQSARW